MCQHQFLPCMLITQFVYEFSAFSLQAQSMVSNLYKMLVALIKYSNMLLAGFNFCALLQMGSASSWLGFSAAPDSCWQLGRSCRQGQHCRRVVSIPQATAHTKRAASFARQQASASDVSFRHSGPCYCVILQVHSKMASRLAQSHVKCLASQGAARDDQIEGK